MALEQTCRRPKDSCNRQSIRWACPSVLLLVLLLFSAILRLYGLADRSLWYDEGWQIAVGHAANHVKDFFDPGFTTDNALLLLLVKGWYALLDCFLAPGTKSFDFMLRLLPCALSVLTIPLIYALSVVLFRNRWSALGAAFILAVSPFQVFYAQELKPYSLYLVVSLAMLLYAFKAIEEDRPVYWFAMIVLSALSFYSHFAAIWNIAALNGYVLLRYYSQRRILVKWFISQACVAILCIPELMLAFKMNAIYENITIPWSVRPDVKTFFISFKTFLAGYSPRRLFYWPLLLVGVILFSRGLWSLRKQWDRLLFSLIMTIGIVGGLIIIWRMRKFPLYEHRTFIVSGALFCAVIGHGIASIKQRGIAYGSLALILILVAPLLSDYYRQNLHPLMTHRTGVRYKVDNRAAAEYIAKHVQQNDRIGHASHFTLVPFYYYLVNTPVPQCVIAVTEDERAGALKSLPYEQLWTRYGTLPERIQDVVPNAERVWFVESWWEPAEVPPHVVAVRNWLDTHMTRIERIPFDGITLYLYART